MIIFIFIVNIYVRYRSYSWKSKEHPFRHAPLNVTGVPTLLILGSPRRLVEEDLTSLDKLQLLFEE